MFADYMHRQIPPSESATELSKITFISGTKQSPILVDNLTKIGSNLSQEERRLHAWAGPLSRDSQHRRLVEFVN